MLYDVAPTSCQAATNKSTCSDLQLWLPNDRCDRTSYWWCWENEKTNELADSDSCSQYSLITIIYLREPTTSQSIWSLASVITYNTNWGTFSQNTQIWIWYYLLKPSYRHLHYFPSAALHCYPAMMVQTTFLQSPWGMFFREWENRTFPKSVKLQTTTFWLCLRLDLSLHQGAE